jgi:hypothetical protein
MANLPSHGADHRGGGEIKGGRDDVAVERAPRKNAFRGLSCTIESAETR